EGRLALGEARAALGEDLHDAVRRVRPVERARGGALDHLDALDVLAVDVGHAEARDGAVHDDQRILAAREARRGTEADRRLGVGLSGYGDDARARHFPLETA